MKLHPNRRTHIDTLADDCPKSRRRIRDTLQWKSADRRIQPTRADVNNAQLFAKNNERAESQRVLQRKVTSDAAALIGEVQS